MGDTRIEYSGENWQMRPDEAERPSIMVTTTHTTHEQWSEPKQRKRKAKKHSKPKPFGFGQALPKGGAKNHQR